MTHSNMHMDRSMLDRMLKKSYEDGSAAGFELGVADVTKKLNAKYEEDLQQAVKDILDNAQSRCDEEFVSAFELGRTSGIEDQQKYQESLQKLQIDASIQVDLPPDDDAFFTPIAANIPLPLTSEVSLQTSPPISLTILPCPTPSLLPSCDPILSSSITATAPVPSLSPKLSWADNSASLPIISLIKAPRDFSALRSNNKPFGTLQHRNRQRYQTAQRILTPPVCFPSSNTNAPVSLHSRLPYQRYPHLSPPHAHLNTSPVIPPASGYTGRLL